MQWTLYGLPMYVVKTGIAASNVRQVAAFGAEQMLGPAQAKRELARPNSRIGSLALPRSLTQLNLSFDFTAPGVFERDSAGNISPLLDVPIRTVVTTL